MPFTLVLLPLEAGRDGKQRIVGRYCGSRFLPPAQGYGLQHREPPPRPSVEGMEGVAVKATEQHNAVVGGWKGRTVEICYPSHTKL